MDSLAHSLLDWRLLRYVSIACLHLMCSCMVQNQSVVDLLHHKESASLSFPGCPICVTSVLMIVVLVGSIQLRLFLKINLGFVWSVCSWVLTITGETDASSRLFMKVIGLPSLYSTPPFFFLIFILFKVVHCSRPFASSVNYLLVFSALQTQWPKCSLTF